MIEQADILIAIDAGTSVIKAVAFTLAGDQIAIAAGPNSYDDPGSRSGRAGHASDMGRLRCDLA